MHFTNLNTKVTFIFNILFLLISALIVRFITKRFIGEYDSNLEKIYPLTMIVDNELVQFEILDAAGYINVSRSFQNHSRF